jgi:hypothetical protein
VSLTLPATTATTRLKRLARPLRPARSPYYLHTPGPHPAEQAPGWYMQLPEQAPMYLGYQQLDAVRTIDKLLELRQPAAAA